MIAEPCKRDGKWEINGKLFDALVIANGHQANGFKETAFLPIKGIAGEITYLPELDQTRGLSYPVCAEGYLSRALNGLHSLGATYEVGERVKKPKNVENLERLESLLGLSSSLLPETLESRVSVRATTPDYVPILGAVPNKEAFVENYHELSKDAKLFIPEPGNYHQNLYVLTGLGSNGLTYAPLSAYLLASIMLGKPQATSTELLKALSPARFLIRDLIRGKYRKP
jgi:tRNA 5-methylaminomethyl-2-thiouridine biosynthesis bifunctional protein